jgi:N-acetylneuraminate synthase
MTNKISIKGRSIGAGEPCYIVAEMSANHGKNFDRAVKIMEEAKKAGADAIKLQTYTPDTMTLNVHNESFKVKGTIWEGRNLYELYAEAYTPWDWHPKLKEIADRIELDFFSTPFDRTALDFLEKLNVPAYKVASFELIDLPLLRRIARTGKSIIISTGMASLSEIDEAVKTIRESGAPPIALLKCTSAYPASPMEMNLRTIPYLSQVYEVPAGLSDHTLGLETALAAVAIGANIVEKHFTLSRKDAGPDSSFSTEPHELREMVNAIRTVEKALGEVSFQLTQQEASSRVFRRSLFVVRAIQAGEMFTEENVKSIRPSFGLHPRYFEEVMGRKARKDIKEGTPLSWELIA